MSGTRLPMRKLRDVLRLTAAGMSSRQVAASLTVGATTVIDYLGRARRAGIAWPLPDDLTDEALEARLYPPPPIVAKEQRPLPDWPTVHRELKRPGVTLQLLWEEHRTRQPKGMGTAGSASSTGPERSGCRRRCGRRMSPASDCSSTTPAPGCRCSTRRRARS